MIRRLEKHDVEAVAGIWLHTNCEAHGFIPESYWEDHFQIVKEMFLQAEVYVCQNEDSQEILGFIGLDQEYIAGIFVRKEAQSRGIGKELLDFVKNQREELTLHVYRKNEGAIRFYKREGFRVQQELVDQDTGEKEYFMVWKHEEKAINTPIILRTARPSDARRLVEIYAPYVTDTAISFEYEVPTVEEFQGRIEKTLERYPYIVAEKNGRILGYSYASAFVGRAAYDWSAELSIYLDMGVRRQGIGRRLYGAMEKILKEMHILNMNACIGWPKEEDEHLTKNSVQFHEHMGFRWVGEFHNSGYKFGRWYNMVWMEKMIGEHPQHPEPVRIFPEVHDEMTGNLLES